MKMQMALSLPQSLGVQFCWKSMFENKKNLQKCQNNPRVSFPNSFSAILFLTEAMGSRKTMEPSANIRVKADGHEKRKTQNDFWKSGKKFRKLLKRTSSLSSLFQFKNIFFQIKAMGFRNTMGPSTNLQVKADGHEKREKEIFWKIVKMGIESVSLIQFLKKNSWIEAMGSKNMIGTSADLQAKADGREKQKKKLLTEKKIFSTASILFSRVAGDLGGHGSPQELPLASEGRGWPQRIGVALGVMIAM
jgi:hypothetical protein